MRLSTSEIELKTQGNTDIIDITKDVSARLQKSGLKEGMAFIFVVGSTAGVTTTEHEPALGRDLKGMFEKLIPKNVSYDHDATWGDANGFSHLRASLLKASLSVPFLNRSLVLGTWQQIVLIDFDNRPRRRKVVVQFQGE